MSAYVIPLVCCAGTFPYGILFAASLVLLYIITFTELLTYFPYIINILNCSLFGPWHVVFVLSWILLLLFHI